MFEQIINFERMEQAVNLFGSFDENIRLIENKYSVKVVCRGSDLKVSGEAENVSLAVRAINGLLGLINKGEALNEQNVRYPIASRTISTPLLSLAPRKVTNAYPNPPAAPAPDIEDMS